MIHWIFQNNAHNSTCLHTTLRFEFTTVGWNKKRYKNSMCDMYFFVSNECRKEMKESISKRNRRGTNDNSFANFFCFLLWCLPSLFAFSSQSNGIWLHPFIRKRSRALKLMALKLILFDLELLIGAFKSRVRQNWTKILTAIIIQKNQNSKPQLQIEFSFFGEKFSQNSLILKMKRV